MSATTVAPSSRIGHVAPGVGGEFMAKLDGGLGALVENAQCVAAVALDELGGGQFSQTRRSGARSSFA